MADSSPKNQPSFSWLYWTPAGSQRKTPEVTALWRLSLRPAQPRSSTHCIFRAFGQRRPAMGRAEGTVRLRKRSWTSSTASLPRASRYKMPSLMCLAPWRRKGNRNLSNMPLLPSRGISASGPREEGPLAPEGEQQTGAVLAPAEDARERGRWMRTCWRC
jgi:hypothetical protein